MSRSGDAARRVLLLAPVGRDASLGCGILSEVGIECLEGRDLRDLERSSLEDLGGIVLTEEALTASTVRTLCERLDAQASWSNLSVILLLDEEQLGRPPEAYDRLKALTDRAGTVVLQRPTPRGTLISIVRAAIADRHRQFELRQELEDRKAAEARAQTLAQEMAHRVKNAFTVASSIAQQTFCDAETVEEARSSFTGRLSALAQAQDLTLPNQGGSADLRELAGRTLAPYQPGRGPDRITIGGPQILIPAEKVSTLAMALHELATNAAKYGALSTPSGCVTVRWSKVQASGTDELAIEWRERGGPPVSPPKRRGFGSLLIEQALSAQLRGSAELVFDTAGVGCEIRAPFPETSS